MLTVDAKFVANELVPGLDGGLYRVEPGTTVRELIVMCETQCGASVPEKNYEFMYPLFNGRPVALDSKLMQDGILHLCRAVSGG